jgi:hypothetical protein
LAGDNALAEHGVTGSHWSDDELDAIVADHFAMLRAQSEGQPYVKAHHARALMERTGRSHRSVEFKHMNISAVLTELGLPTIRGYRPMANYQAAIFDALDRYLTARPDAWALGMPGQTPGFAEDGATYSSPFGGGGPPQAVEGAAAPGSIIPTTTPPTPNPAKPRPPGLVRIIRKFDPAARDHRNRVLGLMGEQRVFDHERAFLIANDRADLARKIEWTSQERGDGAGYDIRSYAPDGRERLIEVKATRGGATTDFFLTRTEREVSQERPDAWRLYRLHDLPTTPGLFQIKPPLEAAVNLSAETWRARF